MSARTLRLIGCICAAGALACAVATFSLLWVAAALPRPATYEFVSTEGARAALCFVVALILTPTAALVFDEAATRSRNAR